MSVLTVKKPFVLTIFGASGDLTKLKLAPAIYSLYEQKRLPAEFYVVGFSRTKKSAEQFRSEFKENIAQTLGAGAKPEIVNDLLRHLYYFTGQYGEPASFVAYRAFLAKLLAGKSVTHLAYFSVPSSRYKDIIGNLARTRASKREDIRLILEKPLGTDKATAEDIFHFASQHFNERQFYLLDHYLGKSAVRSIMHLRESNRILSHMMRGYEVANIQITAFEDFGVKERASYFDSVGTIKDFIQSHLLQIFALVTMSLPIDTSAESLQREKQGVLAAIECPRDPANIVIGQYAGYHSELGVPKNSRAETFAALRLFIDRLDWHGVPIYMRTGKCLAKKQTYVVVELKKFPFQDALDAPNRLVFELHPFEQVHIALLNKQEDPPALQEVVASHSVACDVKEKCLPPGHAPLILDALRGEKKYFVSFAEILAAWDVVDAIGEQISAGRVKLEKYADGSAGPKSQNQLTAQDGFSWYNLPA